MHIRILIKRFVMRFLKDILTEDKNDKKYSSKKTMGVVSGLLACCAFVVDGFNFYKINNHMFDSLLIFSGTMLGASVVRHFTGSKKSPES